MDSPEKHSEQAQGLAAPQGYREVPREKIFPTWERLLKFAGVAGLAVVAAVGYRFWKPEAAKPLTPALHFSPARQLTSGSGLTMAPAVSPDGNLVAFSSDRGGMGSFAIWTKPFDSGEPSRVTTGQFNETDPDFSPDGHTIAFRSERDGGGIYTTPAGGGAEPKLLVKDGWRPRFSPDGQWVAYFTLTGSEDSSASFGVGQVFVIGAGGGEPRRIQPDFPYARFPVWSPDSRRLLFTGTSKDGVKDWWVAPIGGGPAVRTRAVEWLGRSVRTVGYPEQWRDGAVYFSGAQEDATHIWSLPLSGPAMQAAAPPRRLTDGKDQEQQSAMGPGERLVYSGLRFTSEIWSLPIDPDRAQPLGKLKPLTNDRARVQLPSVSANGLKMVYISNRSGIRDVWVGDTSGKGEQAVTSFRQIGYRPVLSPDGSQAVYPASLGGKCAVLLQELTGRRATAPLEGCFSVWDWAPDGGSLLTFEGALPTTMELRKLPSGERRPVLSHPTQGLFAARFSPDGKWIAFTSGLSSPQARVYIAPFKSAVVPEREWILVTPDPGAGEPAWSPDGAVLYFHSKRDGYHCIWAQKLGPGKKPEGEPIAIQHLHASGFGMYFLKATEFGLSVTKDQLILNLAKGEGNLWTTTLEGNK